MSRERPSACEPPRFETTTLDPATFAGEYSLDDALRGSVRGPGPGKLRTR